MDVREKLVEILKQAPFEGKVLDEWWWEEKIKRIADHLINNDVTVQEWISVTERLPDEECRCLVIDAAGDLEMDCYDGKGRFVLDRSGAVQHPSHWMPLPEPPKGE